MTFRKLGTFMLPLHRNIPLPNMWNWRAGSERA